MPTRVPRSTYRHGDLRNALLTAGIELARAGGPDAVVLREATRRVGVAPNAAYRHFSNRDALLDAVCAIGMSQLAVAMAAETTQVAEDLGVHEAAWARLRATGLGYLRYAQDEPGLFRTAFSSADDLSDAGNLDTADATGMAPFQQLVVALDELVITGALPSQRRPDAEIIAWSAVHGLAMLLIDGPLRHVERNHAERLGDHLIDVIMIGLGGR